MTSPASGFWRPMRPMRWSIKRPLRLARTAQTRRGRLHSFRKRCQAVCLKAHLSLVYRRDISESECIQKFDNTFLKKELFIRDLSIVVCAYIVSRSCLKEQGRRQHLSIFINRWIAGDCTGDDCPTAIQSLCRTGSYRRDQCTEPADPYAEREIPEETTSQPQPILPLHSIFPS